MWRKTRILPRPFVPIMLFAFVVSGLSCKNEKTPYRLSRCGYSPSTDTLLLAVSPDGTEPLKPSWLAVYDVEKKSLTHLLYPTHMGLFDFAWAPGQSVFVLTHSDRVTLFRKKASDGGFSGSAVRCPVNVLYMFCAWDPRGEWLAVNCQDLREGFNHRLGLYNLKEEKFVISDITTDYHAPLWTRDGTLYVPNRAGVQEVTLASGAPRVVRTIPIEAGVFEFYGLFDDQVLVQEDNKIKLGYRTLVELDRPSKSAVIATDTMIFVSLSPKDLVVFDGEGREIDRIEPGKRIRFGSIGEDPNAVYGLAGMVLLRVAVENRSLDIHHVCDLADFE